MPTDNTGTLELRLENGSATRATTTVISKEEAEELKKKLEDVGAKVNLK